MRDENLIGQKVASEFAKWEPASGPNAPETSHINSLRGKTMTFHDVMEATLFKKSLCRGSELQSSRARSMEIKTVFVIHILMFIVGGKTNTFLTYKGIGYISDSVSAAISLKKWRCGWLVCECIPVTCR